VLEHYEGTILLVSHDRYLIDRLATQIWEVRHGQMTLFTGTWKEMVAARTNVAVAQVSRGAEQKRANTQAAPPPKLSAVKPAPKTDKEAKRRAKAVAELEEKITLKEVEVGALADMLQATNGDAQRARAVSEEYAYAQRELEELMSEWEQVSKT
jgi:ATP-binding cassette subfamily F protein 3